MARNINFTSVLYSLLLIAFGVGFFLTIHMIDMFRLEQEKVVHEIRRIRAELSLVQSSFDRLSFRTPVYIEDRSPLDQSEE